MNRNIELDTFKNLLYVGNQQPSRFAIKKWHAEGSTTSRKAYTQVGGNREVPLGMRYSLVLHESVSCESSFYVYAYLDPRKPGQYQYGKYVFDFEPFYIGKGKGNRYRRHLLDCKKQSSYKSHKIVSIFKENIKPIICFVSTDLNEQQSFDLEKDMISVIGRDCDKTGPLTNILFGGEGTSGLRHSDATKEKLSRLSKGKFVSQDTKYKIGNANRTRIWKDESKQKIANKRLGTKQIRTPEWKENLTKSMLAGYKSGHRKPVSLNGAKNGMFGKTHTLEARQSISKATTEKNKINNPAKSTEARRKLSEKATIRMSNPELIKLLSEKATARLLRNNPMKNPEVVKRCQESRRINRQNKLAKSNSNALD